MTFFSAIFLGLLQGVTEFLPVSSSGHLVLAHALFGAEGEYALAFDAVLHMATASAVVVYFNRDIRTLVNAALRRLARLPVNKKDMTLIWALGIGTVPAVVFGLMLESLMETMFRNPLLVAGVLVAGSLLFVFAEWRYINVERENTMTIRKGMLIGFFQSLALIPGMSRSGASIAGGMLLGLTRHEAARFAFLLAIPVMLGAGGKKLIELAGASDPIAWSVVFAGAAVAFVTALAAIHFMLSFVRTHTLWPFVWYRVILAGIVVFAVLVS